MATKTNTQSVLIIGGGAWGLSTCLELARNGYSQVKVLDAYNIPSPIAAGNDVNKIVESPDNIPAHGDAERALKRSLELAIESWLHDPVYKPFYHQTGLILSSTSPEAWAGLGTPQEYEESGEYVPLNSPDRFRETMPEGVLTGEFTGWKGWYRRNGAGWCQARKALESVYNEALRLGVEFITEDNGNVSELIIESSKVCGARCRNGVEHYADLVVLSAGSYSNEIFNFENQLRPTAWTLAHIKMTHEELEVYRDLPVLFNNEMGFFMEPDYDRGEMKLCDEHPGYVNVVDSEDLPSPIPGGPATALPRSIPFVRQGLPQECRARLQKFLSDTMPHLKDRELVFGRICWDADTVDRVFLIDRPPQYESLIVAVGASGHGIMNMPAVGKIVRSIIENTGEDVLMRGFRWRPEIAKNRDIWSKQGRFGYGNSNKVMSFSDVEQWVDFERQETRAEGS